MRYIAHNDKKHLLYARKDVFGNYQTLEKHIENVASLCEEFSRCKRVALLSAYLHDLGKAVARFQDYLMYGGIRGSVIHSLQGAIFVISYIDKQDAASVLLKEVLEIVVASHHSTLKNGISPDGEEAFYIKIQQMDKSELDYDEVMEYASALFEDNKEKNLVLEAVKEIETILNVIREKYKAQSSCQFALGLFVKYIYSCLIDADRMDAYLFEIKENYSPIQFDWNTLIDVFESKIKNYGGITHLSNIRSKISQRCMEAATRDSGIYQLSVPTGGGKTYSSLRFALHHAQNKGKKRIIYVIPYLSIIEQTVKNFRNILNLEEDSDILLEHHSNIVPPDNEEKLVIRNLATSRWDYPIIVTTMVQFLETVMSSKSSDLRKFHNMEDSIVIFDEIQSIPISSIHLFNEVVSFLSGILDATILLCTATQPLIGQTERKNLLLSENPNLIDCTETKDASFKRTNIVVEQEMDIDALSAFIWSKMNENESVLAIVNTKREARELFETITSMNREKFYKVYHLSTAMCPAHRFDTLDEIKNDFSNKQKMICISTQLIEAGVDISFACVIRAMAGLDSIAQAAGRCNRNGEYGTIKNVYVVPIEGENLDMLQDIKAGKEVTARIINENEGGDLLNDDILKKYYHYYFFQRRNLMDFPVKIDGNNTSIYELLSRNMVGRSNYKSRTGTEYNNIIGQAFASADENYTYIERNTESVIVYYSEAKNLIDSYKRASLDYSQANRHSLAMNFD